jgi:hypothetical protein
MYAAVPRIIPACVIAGDVIVGDADTSAGIGDRAAYVVQMIEILSLH